ncbi:MAG: DUF3578 domain-containing protein, partial [Anaerolineales bacterium]|nr:DUF3578 domain-containing protein [Anaerolineales bacterium]
MQEILTRIFQEYEEARNQELAQHPLANFIRTDIPSTLANYFPEYENIKWHASAGQGRWSDAPWIAAFNPIITTTARKGFYPVFLFTYSMDSVFL